MSECPCELRNAFEQSFVKMDLQTAMVDACGRIVLATDTLAAQLLHKPEALQSAALDTIFSPRNPAWLSREIRTASSSGVWAGDVILKRADGTEWWAHIQACRAPSPPGAEGEMLLHIEDITERIEITTALMQRTEELYDRNSELEVVNNLGKLLLTNTGIESCLNAVLGEAIGSTGAQEGVIYIKDRRSDRLICRAVGGLRVPNSLIGFSIGPDEDSLALNTVKSRRTQVVEDTATEPFVLRKLVVQYGLKTALSVPIVAGNDAFGVLMLGGTTKGMFGPREISLAEIITNHAAFAIYNAFLGEDVALSRASWQRTFDSIDDPIGVVDPRGTILGVNEAGARRWDMCVSELLNQNLFEKAPEISPETLAKIVAARQPVSLGDIERNGEVFDVQAFPMFDGAGDVDAVVFYARVMTAERRLQDEIRQASRLASVGELLAGAAHSFGNVLMALQGTVESAHATALGSGPKEEVVEKLDRAAEQVARGTEIVRRLLSFSRGAEEAPGGVALREITEAAIELCRTHPAARQRTITDAVPQNLPLVEARPGPLQEVVLNLVLNALQATEPGGEVRVEAEVDESEPCMWLRVVDNGSGMAPETAERAFEPFFSTKRGTGLGLPTSAAAIHRMGGVITVDSRVGEGTVFTVRLNLRNQATSARDKAA